MFIYSAFVSKYNLITLKLLLFDSESEKLLLDLCEDIIHLICIQSVYLYVCKLLSYNIIDMKDFKEDFIT